jgi:hypothetical protein
VDRRSGEADRRLTACGSTIRGIVEAALETGCRKLHFHDLRREVGSRWLDGGVPLQVIRDWLGHANISQTSTYLESTFAGQHEAMRAFEMRLQKIATEVETGSVRSPGGPPASFACPREGCPPESPRNGCLPRLVEPSEKRRAHGLMQVQPLCACGPLEFLPQGIRQSDRSDRRSAARSFGGPAPAQRHRAGRQLRHLPEGQQRRSAGFSSPREGIPAYGAESSEVDRPIQGVSRSRNAFFHGWWLDVR